MNTGAHTGRTPSGDEGGGQGDACRKARDGEQTSKPASSRSCGEAQHRCTQHTDLGNEPPVPTPQWWASSLWDREATRLCFSSPKVRCLLQQPWQANQGGVAHACRPSLHHFRGDGGEDLKSFRPKVWLLQSHREHQEAQAAPPLRSHQSSSKRHSPPS